MPTIRELVDDPDFQALPAERQHSVRRDFFRLKVATDPDFRSLPPERQNALGSEIIFGPEERPSFTQFTREKGPGQIAKEAAGFTGRTLTEAAKGTIEGIKEMGKAAFTPSPSPLGPLRFFTRKGREEVKEFGKGAVSGVTAGIVEPQAQPVEGLTEEEQQAYRSMGSLLGIAAPFGATVRALKAAGISKPIVRELVAGGLLGGAAPAVKGEPEEAATGTLTGAGLVGALGLTGRAAQLVPGALRRAKARLEREGFKPPRREPVFVEELRRAEETAEAYQEPARLTAKEVVEKIEEQQDPEHFDKKKIAKQVEKGGETYVKTEVDPNALKVPGEKTVEPGVSVPEKGAMVVDDKGKVIDGRHRTVDAKEAGETAIEAYVPESAVPDISLTKEAAPRDVATRPTIGRQERIAQLEASIQEGSQRLKSRVNAIGERIPDAELKAVAKSVTNARRELVALRKEAGPTAGPAAKVVKPPRERIATEDQSAATYLENIGGISIQRSPKEAGELRARRESAKGKRIIKAKAGLSVDEAAQRLHEVGFLEEPSARALFEVLDDEIEGRPVFSFKGEMRERRIDLEAEREVARGDEILTERAAEEYAQELKRAKGGFTYEGRRYEKAIPEKEGLRLIDDQDVVLKKPEEILSVEKGEAVAPSLKPSEEIARLERRQSELANRMLSESDTAKLGEEFARNDAELAGLREGLRPAAVRTSEPSIGLKINFPLAKETGSRLKQTSQDPEIAGLARSLGVKEVVIDKPYTFRLSQEGGITQGGVVRLNPNAGDPSRTLLHEFGHIAYRNMTAEQKRMVRNVVTRNLKELERVSPGYARQFKESGDLTEAFPDLVAIRNVDALKLAQQVKRIEQPSPAEPGLPARSSEPGARVRSWDEIREGGGYLAMVDDLRGITEKFGERMIVVKDANGGRHLLPSGVAAKAIENPLFEGHVREVFLPATEVKVGAPRLDAYTLRGLPNMARGLAEAAPELIPEIRKAIPSFEAPEPPATRIRETIASERPTRAGEEPIVSERRGPEIFIRPASERVTSVDQVNVGDPVYDVLLERAGEVTRKFKDTVELRAGKETWTAAVGNRLTKVEIVGPMFERTAAGLQGMIPGTEGREIPRGRVRAKAKQTEELTPLEQAATQRAAGTEPELFPSEAPKPLDAVSRQNQEQVSALRAIEKQRGSIILERERPDVSTGVERVDQALSTTAQRGIIDGFRDLRERILRIFEYEREVKDNPRLVDDLRLFQGERRRAFSEAAKDLDGVVGSLKSREDYTLFSRIVELRDMISRIRSEQKVQDAISLDEAQNALENLNRKATAEVLEAVDRHFQIVDAVGNEKVSRGWMSEEAKREDYFRHRVLLYDQRGVVGGPRRIRPPGKEKAAKGSELAIERDYIRVMYSYLAEHRYKKALEDFIDTQAGKLDRTAEVKAILGEDFQIRPGQIVEVNGRRIKGFQFDPGNQVYPEISIKDSAINKAIKKGLDELGIPIDELEAVKAGEAVTEQLRRGLAIGRKKPTYALDLNVANRLEKFSGPAVDSDLITILNRLTSKWKGLTINFAGMTFQVMNITGDIANIARADLGSLTYLPRAARELLSKKPDAKLLVKLGEELEVLNSGFVSSEVEGLLQTREFNRFLSPAKRAFLSPALVSDRLLSFFNYRENIPRLALFLKNVQRLEGGEEALLEALRRVPEGERLLPTAEQFRAREPLKTAEVKTEGLPPMRAAAKAAREIPVDYGKFTPDENRFLRGLVLPFYSWTKQNTVGWVKFTAQNPGKMTGLALAPWAVMEAWNNTRFPEVEDGLKEYLRERPHIITGFIDENGKHIVLDLGALPASAAAGVLGLQAVPGRISAVMREKITLTEAGKKVLRDVAKAPGKNVLDLLSPLIKVPFELIANKNFFTGSKIVPARKEGTPEAELLRTRHAVESLFRPAREARMLTQQIREGTFDPLTSRVGLGLPLRKTQGEGFIEQFFEELDNLRDVKREVRLLERQGKRMEAATVKRESRQILVRAHTFNRALERMSRLSERIDRIEAMDLSPDVKRQRIDALRRATAMIAKSAVSRAGAPGQGAQSEEFQRAVGE